MSYRILFLLALLGLQLLLPGRHSILALRQANAPLPLMYQADLPAVEVEAASIPSKGAPGDLATVQTNMVGLQRPDPTSQITLIEAPVADNNGSANLRFPLKLPFGRLGLQPDLAITYNSDHPNGWLGVGWDLYLPAVEIETRWGVPRYDPATESETYLLEGSQLWPMAHRGAPQARVAEKRFYPRIEGSFARIIRHGESPQNYWWEVTLPNGTRQSYGGTLTSQSLEESAVLRDDRGNIARWALTETRDVHGNAIQYRYRTIEGVGVAKGSQLGRQLYPESIYYTGFEANAGPFSVHFLLDADLGESSRLDKILNANLGFKELTAHLLRRVEVRYEGQLVRHYELDYRTGAFFKSLLRRIGEYDSEGALFYEYNCDYHDGVRKSGQYQPFRGEENWSVPNDQVAVDFINPLPGFSGATSLLGGSKSSSSIIGSAATVGPIGPLASKEFTVGGSLLIGNAQTEGLLALVDINGDGLVDKVFRDPDANRLYYRANDGESGFGDRRPINGIRQFSTTTSKSRIIGVEANVTPFFVGYEDTKDRSTTETYFSDFNGDQLIDIVQRGRVYFNHLNANGDPEYTLSSADTPSPIQPGGAVDPNIVTVDPTEQAEVIAQNPLHDVVRFWEAPCDGVVRIEAPVQLVPDNSPAAQAYTRADGVRVSIQRGNLELWAANIPAGDFTARQPTNVQAVPVTAGQHLYFRVHSTFDGAYDRVDWDPIITYEGEDPTVLDANKLPLFRYQASEDFTLASCQTTALPLRGLLRVEGTFSKPVTTDSIELQIVQLDTFGGQTILFQQLLPAEEEVVALPVEVSNIPVQEQEELLFRVVSNTNIDWNSLDWQPLMYYTEAGDNVVFDAQGDPLYRYCPAIDLGMYTVTAQKTEPWVAPASDTLSVACQVTVLPVPFGPAAQLTLSAKAKGKLLAKQVLPVLAGGNLTFLLTDLAVEAGDSVYLELHVDKSTYNGSLVGQTATILREGLPIPVNHPVGGYGKRSMDDLRFGPQYRGWGHFIYNGNDDRGQRAFRENDLVIPEVSIDTSDLENLDTTDLIDLPDPTEALFVVMYADPKTQSWRGYDDGTFLLASQVSSARLGDDDVLLNPPVGGGVGASAPGLISESKIHAVAAGVSFGPLGLTGSTAWNTTVNLLDVLDFNGDSYPDIVSPTNIQYTDARGGLLPNAVPHRQRGSHEAKSFAKGGTLGGTYVHSSPSNSSNSSGKGSKRRSQRTKSKVKNSGNKSRSATKSARSGAGISANYTADDDETIHSWLDINGDGLTDKLYQNGDVALNFGYSFGPRENWGFTEIRAGRSSDLGGGLGFNYANNSIAGGVSMSRTDNESTFGFQDLNGDGLIDWMRYADNRLFVRLNLGTGFSEELNWSGAAKLDQGDATGESVNAAFTICIPAVFVRFCINPSTAFGQAVSRMLTEMTDIDGDGFPDQLRSDTDGELKVKRSTIGPTNLLAGLDGPLGGRLELDYALSGNDYGMPFGQWTMREVRLFDGVAGDGADEMKRQYYYQGGRFDRHERSFYGFAEVREQELDTEQGDALYRTTVSRYDVSSYYRQGLILEQRLEDAQGNPYTATQYEYTLFDPTLAQVLPPALEQTDNQRVFPAQTEVRSLYYEGDSTTVVTHRTAYTYDDYGNVATITDFGNGTDEDLLIIEKAYHDLADRYVKIALSEERQLYGGDLLRHRQISVDERGNPIRVDHLLADGSAVTYEQEFDAFGNSIKLINPPNDEGQRMTYQYAYDSVLHTYQVQTEDSYGYVSRQRFDPIYGIAIESEDINGQRTEMTFDLRGRIDTIRMPYELAAELPYTLALEYHPDADVPYAIAHHYDPEHQADIDRVAFTDGLGRVIEEKRLVAVFTNPGQEAQLQLQTSGEDFYDAFGRVRATHYPTLDGLDGLDRLSPIVDPIPPTTYNYDVLDRERQRTRPDGSTTQTVYQIDPVDPLGGVQFQMNTDAQGNQVAIRRDLRGHTVAEIEYGPAGPITTQFTYNALEELVRVTDTEGFSTRYTYDRLGRMIEADHPDQGLIQYDYDPAGNLLSKITPNLRAEIPEGGAIRYTYDFERLIRIDYPKQVQNRVQYHYGAPDATFNRAGRVVLREDASGGAEFYYGPQGEVTKCIRTVLINAAEQRTYIEEASYDTWHRVQQLIYPDGEVVDYGYDRAGNFTSLGGEKEGQEYLYVEQIGYDKFQQVVFEGLGNGTQTSLGYHPQRRWVEQLRLTGSDGPIMDWQLEYDTETNVVSSRNELLPEGMGLSQHHQYAYDERYRMIEATGTLTGADGAQSYSLFQEFDNQHNLRRKQQQLSQNDDLLPEQSYDRNYEYDSDHPHQVARVGGLGFEFDANGNQIGYNGAYGSYRYRQLIWDEEDRLMGVSENGYISRFTYDANHRRVIKSHGGLEGVFVDGAPAGGVYHDHTYTAYVSPLLTVEKEGFSKHYFANGRRILTKQGTGKFNNAYWFGRGLTAGDINYLERLQLIEQSLEAYYAALRIPPGPPTLGGYYAQPEVSGVALPATASTDYYQVPPGWPRAEVPLDTTGPPGPPIRYGEPLQRDSIGAGYGFAGNGVFPEIIAEYYHGDQLGNTLYTTDYYGHQTSAMAYLPTGDNWEEVNLSVPYTFNGKETDTEAGLLHYGRRYYDADFGLWQSTDPLAELYPSWSPYAYVLHNPASLTDPDGRAGSAAGLFNFASSEAAALAFSIEFNAISIQESKEYATLVYRGLTNRGWRYAFARPADNGNQDTSFPFDSKLDPNPGVTKKKIVGYAHTHGAYLSEYGDGNNSFSSDDRKLARRNKMMGWGAFPDGTFNEYDPMSKRSRMVSNDQVPFDPNDPSTVGRKPLVQERPEVKQRRRRGVKRTKPKRRRRPTKRKDF